MLTLLGILVLRIAGRLADRALPEEAARSFAERGRDESLVWLEHMPARLEPRYGYGRPPHARLAALLRRDEETYRRNLERVLAFRDDLLRVPRRPTAAGEPYWLSRWLPGLDAAAIYSFLRATAPARYLEVGSGVSTMWARRAIRDGGLDTSITSIDPMPREEVDGLCDLVHREPLETIDIAKAVDLAEGDVLFMDGSHRTLTNSDATVFFLDVLPELPNGILVGVHDICLPDDYLPTWTDWLWSEQYLMATYLLADGAKVRLELASNFVTIESDLSRVLDPLWENPHLKDVDRRGFTLWMTTCNR
jgi:hypothetical protein